MNLLDRITAALAKIDMPEFNKLRDEINITRHLHPNAEGITQLKLMALKAAHKNSAEAVKALEHLELADEALEFHAVLTKELVEVRDEVNQS